MSVAELPSIESAVEPDVALPWFPVLMLHRVVDVTPRPNPYNLCLSMAGLERVIVWLRRAGFEIVPLASALDAWRRGEPLGRVACLTFDDGYADFASHALPVLERHDCPATVFLVSDRLGESNVWDAASGLPAVPLLSPRQVQSLARRGVSFGAHGATHRRLTGLGAGQRDFEIAGSKASLEDLLDQEVSLFAYPYLDQDASVQAQVAAAGYAAAVGGEQAQHQPFQLHRIDLGHLDSLSLRYRFEGCHYALKAHPAVRLAKRALGRP